MFKKLFLGLVIMASALSFAGPAQMEREEFCGGLAQIAAQAAAAKNLGYPAKDFEDRLAELEVTLADPEMGLTKTQVREVLQAMREAYAVGGPVAIRMQEAYKTCTNQKQA